MKILSERELTSDENLWLDMRNEAIKQTPTRVSEALSRLLTLATAMAGGAIGVLKNDVSTSWGRVLAATFFFLALLVAVIGSLPKTAALPITPVADIREAVRKAIGFKDTCARISVILLVAGVVSAILGIAVYAWA